MEIHLFYNLQIVEENDRWYQDDPETLLPVVEGLERAGLWSKLHFFREEYSELPWRRLQSAEELLQALTTVENGYWELNSEVEDPNVQCRLILQPRELQVRVTLVESEQERLDSHAVDRLIDCVLAVYEDFQGRAMIDNDTQIVELTDFPDLRPNWWNPRWNKHSIVEFYDRDYQTNGWFGLPEELATLSNAELPEHFQRIQHGGLFAIRWVDDVGDQQRLIQRKTQRALFLSQCLDFPLGSDFNTQGDQRLSAGLEPWPGLTFYDPTHNHGFRGIVWDEARARGCVDWRAGLDKKTVEELDQLLKWKRAGELPDGNPLERMHLILPKRESVLAIRDRARAMGFDRVFYPKEENNWLSLWDVAPPGCWLSDTGAYLIDDQGNLTHCDELAPEFEFPADTLIPRDPFSFAYDDYSAAACDALRTGDIEILESLRNGPVVDILPQLVRAYHEAVDWEAKNAIVFLLQDCADVRLRDVMSDAIFSPSIETQAIAVCMLCDDRSLFPSLLEGGVLQPDRVASAVKRLLEHQEQSRQ